MRIHILDAVARPDYYVVWWHPKCGELTGEAPRVNAVEHYNGAEGVLDVAALMPFDGVFASLQDPSFFSQVHVDQESGTIAWPGNLDLDPYTLYVDVTGKELRLNDGTVVRPSMVPSR